MIFNVIIWYSKQIFRPFLFEDNSLIFDKKLNFQFLNSQYILNILFTTFSSFNSLFSIFSFKKLLVFYQQFHTFSNQHMKVPCFWYTFTFHFLINFFSVERIIFMLLKKFMHARDKDRFPLNFFAYRNLLIVHFHAI
jgi:hypothetical protein